MRSSAFCGARLLGVAAFLLIVAGVAPASAQQNAEDRLVAGVTIGGGLVFYQGDLDTNPGNNYIKFLGASNLRLLAGVDRRYEGYSLGVEVSYSRLSGEREFGSGIYSFTNNLASVDAVGSIDLGLFEPGLIRLYLGVGPTLLASPQYSFPEEQGDTEAKELGTRIRPGLKLGLNVQDAVRIGTMALPSDYMDGVSGVSFPFDQVVFISVNYRFDLTD